MKMNFLSELFANVGNVTWQHAVMWCIGGVLIYLAIAKKMEQIGRASCRERV